MLKVLACEEGGSVTCAILKVVDELGRDPSGFQWWASIVIPAIASLASVAVLAFSVWTANSSRKQALATEEARVEAESRRVEDERKRRFKTRLAEMLEALPSVLEDIQGGKPQATNPILARLIAATLEANADERELLDELRTLALTDERNPQLFKHMLSAGCDIAVEWVNATSGNRMKLIGMLAKLRDLTTNDELSKLVHEAWSLSSRGAHRDELDPSVWNHLGTEANREEPDLVTRNLREQLNRR